MASVRRRRGGKIPRDASVCLEPAELNDPADLHQSPPPAGREHGALVIEGAATSAAAARNWLASCLPPPAVPVTQLDDATLILSELVTNAWLHGAGEVAVRVATASNGDIQLFVSDADPTLPVPARSQEPHLGGWGLQIVNALAGRWGVDPKPPGKTVWATVPSARTR